MSGTRYLRPGDRLTLVRRDTTHVLTEPHYVTHVDGGFVRITSTTDGSITWGDGGAVVDLTFDEEPDDAA